MRTRILICLFAFLCHAGLGHAGTAVPAADHLSRLDLSEDRYLSEADSLKHAGYRIVSLDLRDEAGRPSYTAVWSRTAGPAWIGLPSMSAAGLQSALAYWAARGFSPAILTAAGSGGPTSIFAAVLDKDSVPTAARTDLDIARFQAACDSAQRNHSILTWMDAYGTPSRPLFAGIWKRNLDDTPWNYSLGDDETSLHAKIDAFARVWVRPAFLARLPDGKYFTLWQENSAGPWAMHPSLAAAACGQALAEGTARGLHPVCLQAFPDGSAADTSATAFSVLLTGQDRPLPRRWTVTGPASPGLTAFDDYMRSLMQAYGVRAGALAMAHEGKLVFAHGYTWGEAGYPETQPNSLFRVASCSKPLTSIVIHRMLREAGAAHGALSLKEKILSLLHRGSKGSESRDPADARFGDITVDQLLTHSGGWVRSRENPDPVFNDYPAGSEIRRGLPASRSDFLAYMLGRPLQYAPGSRSVYDNFGYFLLGRIIETLPPSPGLALGQSYETVVKDMLFKPLGLSRPRFGGSRYEERAPGEVLYHARIPYLQRDPYAATPTWVAGGYGDFDLKNMDAAGAWLLSAPDYAKVLASFDLGEDDPVLAPQAVATMWMRGPAGADDKFLRGWFAIEVPGGKGGSVIAKWHSGLFPGTSTLIFYRPDKWSFALFLNRDIPPQLTGDRQGRELSRLADAVAHWPEADLFPEMGIPAFHGEAVAAAKP